MATILIKIENKEYKISNEGFYPMILFKRETGKNYSEIDNEDFEQLLTFIWCYFVSYNIDFHYTKDEFFKICTLDIIAKFNELNGVSSDDLDPEKKI